MSLAEFGTFAREEYLTTQVFTATPQRLQLMLIDAAIRNCLLAQDDLRTGEMVSAGESILKVQEIATEILAAARQEPNHPIGKQIVALYTFLFRQLVQVHMSGNLDQLQAVITVLEEERETWRLVCEKFGAEQPTSGATFSPQSPTFAPVPHVIDVSFATGFSCEA